MYGDLCLTPCKYFSESSPLVILEYIHPLSDEFGFEFLHNINLGVSENMKNIFLNYVSSKIYPDISFGGICTGTFFVRFANDYLAEVDEWNDMPNICLNISSNRHDGREDGVLNLQGLRGMIEGRFSQL